MKANWTDIARGAWNALADKAEVGLHQDWAYGQAMSHLGGRPLRAIVKDGDTPVALAQFLIRDFAGLARAALCSHGPVWLARLDTPAKAEIYRELRRSSPLARPRFTLFTPADLNPGDSLRRAGLNKVMTGYSTVLIDLTQNLEELLGGMRQKWRNRLRAAERSDLKLIENGSKPSQYRWLLNQETGQRAAKKYKAPPIAFAEAYQAAKGGKAGARVFRADLGREQSAGMMFLTHGRRATYHIGWANDAGRKTGAHNLILWTAINALKNDGYTSLDLGGVDTRHGAGVARFKLGVGGRLETLPGTYL
ncbi:MAG: GNAT family N-acetyltransferase [Pseudomonadota bacterium]